MTHIEKTINIQAPVARVWKAITDAEEFGAWFGCRFTAPFALGPMTGVITSPGHEGIEMAIVVERIEPEREFAFRWHPYAEDPDHDFSREEKTLVTFRLAPDGDGTALTITETGFEGVPAWRRDVARRMNDGGWAIQIERIRAHVAG